MKQGVGALDRYIRIEQAGRVQSGSGEETLAWPPVGGMLLAACWAERLNPTAHEQFRAQQPVAEVITIWRIRWQDRLAGILSPSQTIRLIDEGRVYDITGVVEIGRREGWEITGKARAE